jgi:Suppressor of fused protein (SUFU)
MTRPTEHSPGGSRVYRHEPQQRDVTLATGDLVTIQAVEAHVTRHIGPIKSTFHELVSDLVHIDVHIVEPSTSHPYYTLVTSGMSERPMTVPAGCEAWQFAELMLCLPASWPVSDSAFQDEANYWPVRWLKRLARLPHEYTTWLAPTHTIPNGDPAQPFSAKTQLCCALISQPIRFGPELLEIEVSPTKTVQLLSLVPLYREEMDYKLQRGCDALYERLDAAQVTELLDVRRKNTCARRFGFW